MASFLATRLVGSVVNVFLITVLIFALLHVAPGDPTDLLTGPDATERERAAARHAWGLDRPLPVQYLAYLGNLVRGDLGTSLYFQEPVARIIGTRAAATLELGAVALLLITVVSFALGVLAAARAHGLVDHALMALAVAGVSMPAFWLALLLILLLGGALQLLPVAGRLSYGIAPSPLTGFNLVDSALGLNGRAFWDALQHLVLPAVSLAGAGIAFQSRLLRANLLEVLQQDYVRTARAKGLAEAAVIGRHAVWNALIPVLNAWGLVFVFLLSGSVVVETVFAWPGLGRTAIQAIGNRDYPLVQGIALVFIVLVVAVHLVLDVLFAWIDPRVRHA